jgi:thymidylate kinase
MQIASIHNVSIVQKIWHGYFKCAYILSPLSIDERFRLQLDFFTDFSAKGFPNLIPNEILLKDTQKYKNFVIPTPEMECVFIIMRRIIKNDLNFQHINTLRSLIEREADKINKKIYNLLGEILGDSIISTIKKGNLEKFALKIDDYRAALKRWSRRNTDIPYFFKYYTHQFKRIFYRLLYPVGFSVAFLGPDGSGKSTIARLTLDRVSGSFHGCKLLYWRPSLLPAMGRLKVWDVQNESETNPRPHDHPQQNRFKSLLRFFYYLLDYIIGYPIKVYWAKVKKQIVCFDRYYYDYFVDLHRYRFNIPKWLPKIFMHFVPSPDITIYLDAEPEILIRRKQELSIDELTRQVQQFRSHISLIPKSFVVRTDRQTEEIVKEIAFLILSKKAEETKKILYSKPR